MDEKQVSVKLQVMFPGYVEPGLREAVGGAVQKIGQAEPTGALRAFLRGLTLML